MHSNKFDFLKHLEIMKSWFEVRGYPNKLIEEEKKKVKFLKNCKRCEVCLNVNETFTFTSTVTSETYIINHKFNCKDKGLVYLLTCNCCKNVILGLNLLTNFVLDGTITKVISGNINVAKQVWNNNHISIFAAGNHNCFISDVSTTFIDKTGLSDSLKREDCWRSIQKTMAPFGLNIEESV